MKDLFLLRDDITFLNFGSFGATPKELFDDYVNWQLLLEKEPVQFITVDGYRYLNEARKALGKFISADFENLIFASQFVLKQQQSLLHVCHDFRVCVFFLQLVLEYHLSY